jgi:lipopolysaccharide-binding protein
MDITVQGGDSWFYQVFVNLFKGNIQNVIENAIQNELSSVLTQMINNYLKQMYMIYNINSDLALDYSIISSPKVTSSYIETKHLGNFIWIPTPSIHCSLQPNILPDKTSNFPFTFLISENMMNCFGEVLFKAGKIQKKITPEDIPSNSPVQLNTSNISIRTAIPNLYVKYPNKGIILYIYENEAPIFKINSVQKNFIGFLNIYMNVSVKSDKLLIPVFTLGFKFQFSTLISLINNHNITGKINNITYDAFVVWSAVGNINIKDIDALTTLFIDLIIQPTVNSYLQQGFPIPKIYGIELTNININYENKYFEITSDFKYNNNLWKMKKISL